MLAFIQAFFTLLKAFLREIHTCLWKRHGSVGPVVYPPAAVVLTHTFILRCESKLVIGR